MKKVFLTGATGVMGMKGMKSILDLRDKGKDIQLTVLARPSKVNRRKLQPYIKKGVEVIWGDLLDRDSIEKGVSKADMILHLGGMVSPMADWYPEKTYEVNTKSMSLIVEAARRKEARGEVVRVVYIGSVAQYGNRPYPNNWGRTGDPICSTTIDKYSLSKNMAEMILSESGLKEWVSLRQTGILHPGLLGKVDDPIAFHVPMATGLEWITDEDSGHLLAALCGEELDRKFWKNFYNIGGGESYRMSNYEFLSATLGAVGCPPPERIFNLNWFAIRNFHGMYFEDSDDLDEYLHYRSGEIFERYMTRLKKGLPFYFRLAPLAPAAIIKKVMEKVANKDGLGPQRWIKEKNMPRIEAAYGSPEAYEAIGDWNDLHLPPLKEHGHRLDHGYDETKTLEELTFGDLRKAAVFRGGRLKCYKDDSELINNPDESLEWECGEGHRFRLTPRTVLKGGHWCPDCLALMERDPKAIKRLAQKNRFLCQIALI